MSAKQNEPSAVYSGDPAQLEAWAEQILGVLKKVAQKASLDQQAVGRPLSSDALLAVVSFIDLDRKLEVLPVP
jgi:hypothetical protein